jgi:hypothetical protein
VIGAIVIKLQSHFIPITFLGNCYASNAPNIEKCGGSCRFLNGCVWLRVTCLDWACMAAASCSDENSAEDNLTEDNSTEDKVVASSRAMPEAGRNPEGYAPTRRFCFGKILP